MRCLIRRQRAVLRCVPARIRTLDAGDARQDEPGAKAPGQADEQARPQGGAVRGDPAARVGDTRRPDLRVPALHLGEPPVDFGQARLALDGGQRLVERGPIPLVPQRGHCPVQVHRQR